MARRILFRIFRGFIYGIGIGVVTSVAMYIFASAVSGITQVIDPKTLAGITFGATVVMGVAAEYGRWLEEKESEEKS